MTERYIGNSGDVYKIRDEVVYRIWADGLEGRMDYDPEVVRALCTKQNDLAWQKGTAHEKGMEKISSIFKEVLYGSQNNRS